MLRSPYGFRERHASCCRGDYQSDADGDQAQPEALAVRVHIFCGTEHLEGDSHEDRCQHAVEEPKRVERRAERVQRDDHSQHEEQQADEHARGDRLLVPQQLRGDVHRGRRREHHERRPCAPLTDAGVERNRGRGEDEREPNHPHGREEEWSQRNNFLWRMIVIDLRGVAILSHRALDAVHDDGKDEHHRHATANHHELSWVELGEHIHERHAEARSDRDSECGEIADEKRATSRQGNSGTERDGSSWRRAMQDYRVFSRHCPKDNTRRAHGTLGGCVLGSRGCA